MNAHIVAENSPEQRRAVAVKVNAGVNGKGKVKQPQWIDTTDELVEQAKRYFYTEYLSRYPDWGNYTETEARHIKMSAEMYADLSAKSLEYHIPALTFLFKRYLTQR